MVEILRRGLLRMTAFFLGSWVDLRLNPGLYEAKGAAPALADLKFGHYMNPRLEPQDWNPKMPA